MRSQFLNFLISSVNKSVHVLFYSRIMVMNGKYCRRFFGVAGLEGRKNDIIFCSSIHKDESGPSSGTDFGRIVVYFGGDSQDYRERMEKHRENKRYAEERNLESTVLSLAKKFPSSAVLAVKPFKMYLGTFACYSNFLPCNDIGAPVQPPVDNRAWEHLKLLSDSVGALLGINFAHSPVTLIGFSKGAVVLNQLVYELNYLRPGSVADEMVDRVRCWYWLDGAHAGSKGTWITDSNILDKFADRIIQREAAVNVHVTPRQVRDPSRPWIREEESKFSRHLERRLGERFLRKIHFEQEPPSLENHFRVLDVFEPDKNS